MVPLVLDDHKRVTLLVLSVCPGSVVTFPLVRSNPLCWPPGTEQPHSGHRGVGTVCRTLVNDHRVVRSTLLGLYHGNVDAPQTLNTCLTRDLHDHEE